MLDDFSILPSIGRVENPVTSPISLLPLPYARAQDEHTAGRTCTRIDVMRTTDIQELEWLICCRSRICTKTNNDAGEEIAVYNCANSNNA